MSDACTCPTTELIRAAIQGHIDTAVRAERERIAQAIETDPSVRLGHNVSFVCSCLRCDVAHAAANIARQEPTP